MSRESRVVIGILVILLSAFLVYDVTTSMAIYQWRASYYMPHGYSPGYGGYGGMMMNGMMGYGYPDYSPYAWDKLTDDQKAAIQDKISELLEKGVDSWEIRTEVFKLLNEFGVLGNESTQYYPRYPYGGGMMGHMMGMMHGGMYAYGPGYGHDWNATRAFPYAPGYGG